MHRVPFLILLALSVAGCASRSELTLVQKAEGQHWLAFSTAAQKTTVDVSDGVSEVEAFKIAEEYFFTKNGNICGMVGVPKKEGASWRVPILEGMFPIPTKDVVVDAKTGSYRIEAKKNEPNKAPEPTPTAGTSAAELPRVPAAVVAHL